MDVEEKQKEEKNTALNIGALLVEARENQNLSAQDIADQLNLMLVIVERIERNEFEQEIPLTFIRGYVRSYGQKVGVDLDSLCKEFDRQTLKAEEPIHNIKRISPFGEKRRELSANSPWFKIVTYLIVGVLLVFGGWELWKRVSPKFLKDKVEANQISLSHLDGSESSGNDSLKLESDSETMSNNSASTSNEIEEAREADNSETSQSVSDRQLENVSSSSSSSESQENADETGDTNSIMASESQNDKLASSESTSKEPTSNEPASNVSSDNDSTNVQSTPTQLTSNEQQNDSASIEKLTGPIIEAVFTFSDDCWVQITDANGDVLAVGIKKDGKVMPLSGVAPWNVVLGDPSVVSMTLQNEDYDLSGYRAGRRAKFILE